MLMTAVSVCRSLWSATELCLMSVLAGKIGTNIAGAPLRNAADNASSKHQTTEPGVLLCLISFSARNQSSSGEPFDLSLSVQYL